MSQSRAPLFPLSAHLLPGGRLALRIFEPRYVRMVKTACANDSGFVMCMLNPQADVNTNQHIYPLGTFAKVVDFTVLPDGLLGITVEGQYNVEVSHIETEDDGLRTGQCSTMELPEQRIDNQQVSHVSEKLKEVFEQYQELRNLYDEFDYEDPIWVMNRWMELLPIDVETKQRFLAEKSYQNVLDYLNLLVE